jgi:hypothetical protein
MFHEQDKSPPEKKRRHELTIQMGGSDPNTHLAKSDLRTNVNEQRRSRLNLKFLLRQGLQSIDHASLCLQTVSETEPRHLDSSYLRVSFPDPTTQRKVVYWLWASSRSSSNSSVLSSTLTSSSPTQEHTHGSYFCVQTSFNTLTPKASLVVIKEQKAPKPTCKTEPTTKQASKPPQPNQTNPPNQSLNLQSSAKKWPP